MRYTTKAMVSAVFSTFSLSELGVLCMCAWLHRAHNFSELPWCSISALPGRVKFFYLILNLSGGNIALSRASHCRLGGPGIVNDALFPPRLHITGGGKLIGLVKFMSRSLKWRDWDPRSLLQDFRLSTLGMCVRMRRKTMVVSVSPSPCMIPASTR